MKFYNTDVEPSRYQPHTPINFIEFGINGRRDYEHHMDLNTKRYETKFVSTE